MRSPTTWKRSGLRYLTPKEVSELHAAVNANRARIERKRTGPTTPFVQAIV